MTATRETASRAAGLIGDIATVVLAGCALLVTGIVVWRQFPESAPTDPKWRQVDNWQEIAEAGTWDGNELASVRVVEFADFQCPFCAVLYPRLRELQSEFPDHVAVSYRHFPLEAIHPYAKTAALAAECAGDFGRKNEMAAELYSQRSSLGKIAVTRLADAAGVRDTAAFAACVADERYRTRVEAEKRQGESLHLAGTPAVLIDGFLYLGAPSLEDMRLRVVASLRPPEARPRRQH